MRSTKRMLLAAALTIPLTGCGATLITGTDASCRAFQVITFSGANDTAETVAQVREHNAVFRALGCEKLGQPTPVLPAANTPNKGLANP